MSPFHTITVNERTIGLGAIDVALQVDPKSATATVELDGRTHRIRSWTFGERRHLLDLFARDRSQVDVEAVVAAAGATLVDPPADAKSQQVLGLAALAWSAGAGSTSPANPPGVDPATEVVELASVTGWTPAVIDRTNAADVDRWHASIQLERPTERPASQPSNTDGFVSFRLEN